MKKIAVVIVVIAAVIIGVVFKSQGLDSTQRAEYYSMIGAYSDMQYNVDVSKYEDAMLFLMMPSINNNDELQKAKSKYANTIADSLFADIQNDMTSNKDDSEQTEDSLNSSDNEDIPTDTNSEQNHNTYVEETDEYPIYGIPYSIVGYGTKEESQDSQEEFRNTPVNSIKSTCAYKDIICVTAMNKYTGLFMMQFKLDSHGMIYDCTSFK